MSKNVQSIVAAVQKKFGKTSALCLGNDAAAPSEVREVVPTGIEVFDKYLLACGGIPIGKVSVIAGQEASGKTSLAYQWIAAFQRVGGDAVFINSEFSYDKRRAAVFGCNTQNLALLQPDTYEKAVDSIMLILSKNDPTKPLLIVWDSVSGGTPEAEKGEPAKQTFSKRSQMVSKLLQQVVEVLPSRRAHLLIISQLRANVGVLFGAKEKLMGGKGIYFFPSWIAQMFPATSYKDSHGEHTGRQITVVVTKSRFSPPNRKARIRLDYNTGFNDAWSTVRRAKELKLIRAADSAAPANSVVSTARFKLGWSTDTPTQTTHDEESE